MIEIVPAKNGEPTLSKDGKFILSSYHPRRDIERYVQSLNIQEGKTYILFSSALGYLSGYLAEQMHLPSPLPVYEPAPELAEHAGKHSSLISLNNLSQLLEKILLDKKRPEILVLPAIRQAFPQEYAVFQQRLEQGLRIAAENLKVGAFFSRVWFLNYCRNLSYSVNSSLRFVYQPQPAQPLPMVLAVSGPSLDTHLDTLRVHRERYVLLSVLSAVRTLLSAGMVPDAVVISDAGTANKLHAAGLPPEVPVFASVYASSALLCALPNPVMFYDLSQELSRPVFRLDSPSVAIDAGLLCLSLSAEPLVFAGFDLAYSRRKSHSRGNALTALRLNRTDRIKTLDSAFLSFLRRKDMELSDGVLTQPQFRLVRDHADKLFAGRHYIRGGLNFPSLHPFDINALSSLPIREKWDWQSQTAPLPREDIREHLRSIQEQWSSLQPGLLETVLIRAYLSGSSTAKAAEIIKGKIQRLFSSSGNI